MKRVLALLLFMSSAAYADSQVHMVKKQRPKMAFMSGFHQKIRNLNNYSVTYVEPRDIKRYRDDRYRKPAAKGSVDLKLVSTKK